MKNEVPKVLLNECFCVLGVDIQEWNCWVAWQLSYYFNEKSPHCLSQGLNQTTFPPIVHKSSFHHIPANTVQSQYVQYVPFSCEIFSCYYYPFISRHLRSNCSFPFPIFMIGFQVCFVVIDFCKYFKFSGYQPYLSGVLNENIFSCSVSCLFVLACVSFATQNHLIQYHFV